MLGPESKGRMSLCPIANDNLCIDEICHFKIQSGMRTNASERDLVCELLNGSGE